MTAGRNNYNILHIVAHSFALASDPSNGGLLMSSRDGKKEDILTVRDLQHWPHPLQLLTLAGCETGLVRAEGAFLSDVQSLVTLGVVDWLAVSLWNLQDDSGSLITKEFYARIFSGEPLPEAMWRAQLLARKAYPAPAQWASVALFISTQN